MLYHLIISATLKARDGRICIWHCFEFRVYLSTSLQNLSRAFRRVKDRRRVLR